jgi:hypothetical protein
MCLALLWIIVGAVGICGRSLYGLDDQMMAPWLCSDGASIEARRAYS